MAGTARRRVALVAAVLGVLALVVGAPPASATTARMSERPPECVKVRVENPSGRTWWLEGCGTGSGGETWINPALAGHGPLQVDGAFVQPNGCGSFASPCVVTWASSPPS